MIILILTEIIERFINHNLSRSPTSEGRAFRCCTRRSNCPRWTPSRGFLKFRWATFYYAGKTYSALCSQPVQCRPFPSALSALRRLFTSHLHSGRLSIQSTLPRPHPRSRFSTIPLHGRWRSKLRVRAERWTQSRTTCPRTMIKLAQIVLNFS